MASPTRDWLERSGYDNVTEDLGRRVWIGRRSEATRRVPYLERDHAIQEVAAIEVTRETLRTSTAQGYVNSASRWRDRAKGRMVAAVVPDPELGDVDLLQLQGVDLVVRLANSIYPAHQG